MLLGHLSSVIAKVHHNHFAKRPTNAGLTEDRLKVHIVQHSAGDGAGAVETFLTEKGCEISYTRLDRKDSFPSGPNSDVLMTFGAAASMAMNRPPWVDSEQTLVRQYVDADKPILGICFGSQLVASALGAEVKRNDFPEVGWFPVEPTEAITDTIAGTVFTEPIWAFHWHEDTFEIPPGAKPIFRSDGCTNQGYALGNQIYGFQFHLEANQRTVDIFLAASSMHRRKGEVYVQNADQIRQQTDRHLANQTQKLREFLSTWLQL